MNLPYPGEPADWMATGGKPARVLGERMMPSYETDDGVAVMDLCIVQRFAAGVVMTLPASYGRACIVAPDGPVPLHLRSEPGTAHEWWRWRPILHKWRMECWWQQQGSQGELAYRYGLHEIMAEAFGEGNVAAIPEAEARADELLLRFLNPQQRLELATEGNFRCVGAATGNYYRVTLGDGFDLIGRHTGETIVSYCLHTEHWLPVSDLALACKLALEDPEMEVEALTGAKGYPRPPGRAATPEDREATRLEREHSLLPLSPATPAGELPVAEGDALGDLVADRDHAGVLGTLERGLQVGS